MQYCGSCGNNIARPLPCFPCRFLFLHYNSFSGSIPACIGQLTALTYGTCLSRLTELLALASRHHYACACTWLCLTAMDPFLEQRAGALRKLPLWDNSRCVDDTDRDSVGVRVLLSIQPTHWDDTISSKQMRIRGEVRSTPAPSHQDRSRHGVPKMLHSALADCIQLANTFFTYASCWANNCLDATYPQHDGCGMVERPALVDLFVATTTPGVAGWRNSSNWLSDANPCTWAGVTSNTAQNAIMCVALLWGLGVCCCVRRIDCAGWYVAVDSHTTLTSSDPLYSALNLANNSVVGTLPNSLVNLTALTALILDSNGPLDGVSQAFMLGRVQVRVLSASAVIVGEKAVQPGFLHFLSRFGTFSGCRCRRSVTAGPFHRTRPP